MSGGKPKMPICPYCGKHNPSERKNCQDCGTKLSAPRQNECRRCGALTQGNDILCVDCIDALGIKEHGSPAEEQSSVSSAKPPTPPVAADQGDANSHQSGEPHRPTSSTPHAVQDDLGRTASTPRPELHKTLKEIPSVKPRLIPTHELLQMANAVGISIDYTTLRFWQKRGLVPNPLRGPIDDRRGTRGYYDASLIDRIAFIRAIQRNHNLGLEAIRAELDRIDHLCDESQTLHASSLYQARLAEMQALREVEAKHTLFVMLSKAVGITPEEIATVVIRKKNGQTVQLVPENKSNEPGE
jgi:DNA-binding transcriptional MerR regulator